MSFHVVCIGSASLLVVFLQLVDLGKSYPVAFLENRKLGSFYVQYHEVSVVDSNRCHDRVQELFCFLL